MCMKSYTSDGSGVLYIGMAIVSALLFLHSCQPDLPALQQPVTVGTRGAGGTVGATDAKTVSEQVAHLSEQMQVVINALQIVQEAYLNTAGSQSTADQTTVLVDERYTLALRTQGRRSVKETRVNLIDLDDDLQHMEILVDGPDGNLPGCRIPVLPDRAPVVLYENGRRIGEADRLELTFSDRPTVQRALSGMMLAIRAASGEL